MEGCPVDLERFVEEYDHFNPDFAQDPFSVWDEMRDRCPMAHSTRHDSFWILTRYEDLDRVAHDTSTFSSRKVAVPGNQFSTEGSDEEFVFPPLTSDPPFHSTFRRMLLPAFSPKAIAVWEPVTWQIANDLIDGFIGRSEIDAAQAYAQHIPVAVISRMLGVDENDRDTFTDWIRRIMHTGPLEAGGAKEAVEEMAGYLWAKIVEHRERPQQDIITFLIDSEVDEGTGASWSTRSTIPTQHSGR